MVFEWLWFYDKLFNSNRATWYARSHVKGARGLPNTAQHRSFPWRRGSGDRAMTSTGSSCRSLSQTSFLSVPSRLCWECTDSRWTMPVESRPIRDASIHFRLLQHYLFLLKKYPILTKSVTRWVAVSDYYYCLETPWLRSPPWFLSQMSFNLFPCIAKVRPLPSAP